MGGPSGSLHALMVRGLMSVRAASGDPAALRDLLFAATFMLTGVLVASEALVLRGAQGSLLRGDAHAHGQAGRHARRPCLKMTSGS